LPFTGIGNNATSPLVYNLLPLRVCYAADALYCLACASPEHSLGETNISIACLCLALLHQHPSCSLNAISILSCLMHSLCLYHGPLFFCLSDSSLYHDSLSYTFSVSRSCSVACDYWVFLHIPSCAISPASCLFPPVPLLCPSSFSPPLSCLCLLGVWIIFY